MQCRSLKEEWTLSATPNVFSALPHRKSDQIFRESMHGASLVSTIYKGVRDFHLLSFGEADVSFLSRHAASLNYLPYRKMFAIGTILTDSSVSLRRRTRDAGST